jgi:hypothetical protein
MTCTYCGHRLQPMHGHMTCLHNGCPMFGLNHAECCSGDTCALPDPRRAPLTMPGTDPSVSEGSRGPIEPLPQADPTLRNQRSSKG